MVKEKDSIEIIKESSAKLGSFLKKGADKAKDKLLLLRPLSKKEEWSIESLKEYVSEETAKKIIEKVKQKKAELKFIQKGFSFLVVNKDLVPQLDSAEFEELNKDIEKEYYTTSFKNFTERAWQALPQYIGPNTLGQLEIKQAISLQLFSTEPVKILILGKINAEMLTSARKLANSDVQILTNFSADSEADFDKSILTKAEKKTKTADKFDLLFYTKVAVLEEFEDIAEKIISGSKAKVKDADIDFLKEYIKHAKSIEAEIPNNLADKLKNYVVSLKKKEDSLKYKVTPAFVACVVSLCKASARMELRAEVQIKDLTRVFEIIDKSIKSGVD